MAAYIHHRAKLIHLPGGIACIPGKSVEVPASVEKLARFKALVSDGTFAKRVAAGEPEASASVKK